MGEDNIQHVIEALNWYERQEEEKRAVSFSKNDLENTRAVSLGSRARLSQTQNGLKFNFKVRNHCFVLNSINPINEIFTSLIYFLCYTCKRAGADDFFFTKAKRRIYTINLT